MVDLKRDVQFEQRLGSEVPLDARFRDETGTERRLGDYLDGKTPSGAGRPVVLMLVQYRCPMLCGIELQGLVRAMRTLAFDAGQEYDVLTVSFDPREGTELAADKHRNYLEAYDRPGTESGWHFLTGEDAAIRRLAEAVGFRYAYDPQVDRYAHAAGLVVLTPQGRVSKYFYGVEFSPKDLRLGLVEASENEIGSAVDQVLLYCYHYDPTTGKYGFAIMNALRAAGALTVFTLAGGIVILIRRERRRTAQTGEQEASASR